MSPARNTRTETPGYTARVTFSRNVSWKPQGGQPLEEAARRLAADLGTSAFVYKAALVRQGAGSRELGDAILYANGRGAIIQVKTRQADKVRPGEGQRWLDSEGQRARRQGIGSKRTVERLRASGNAAVAYPSRCEGLTPPDIESLSLTLDMDTSSWPVIVILDHPHIERLLAPTSDVFWVTMLDWALLNQCIRSITHLIGYVVRALASPKKSDTPALGMEIQRLERVVNEDANDSRSDAVNAHSALEHPNGVNTYRDLMTRAWPAGFDRPAGPITDLRQILDFFDLATAKTQAEIGDGIRAARKRLSSESAPFCPYFFPWAPGWTFGYCCALAEHPNQRVVEVTCKAMELAVAQAVYFGRLAHTEPIGLMLVIELGNGKTGFDGALHSTQFRYFRPVPYITQDVVSYVLHKIGVWQPAGFATISCGRNQICPCGSGRKLKHCKAWQSHEFGTSFATGYTAG